MIPGLNWIWRVQWWCSFFLFFFKSIFVWEKCFEKSKLFIEAEIWNQHLFEYVQLDGDFFCFILFCFVCLWLDIPFMGIIHKLMIQKFKIVSLSLNLVLSLIWICRIQWLSSILLLWTGYVTFGSKFGIQYWCSILPFSNGNALFKQV